MDSTTFKDELTLPYIFITGNSRSGTTMMMRVLDNHSQAHSINEPHFFEKLWSPNDAGKKIKRTEAFTLLAKLFTGQRAGFFEPVSEHVHKYEQEIQDLLGTCGDGCSRMQVYARFMLHETRLAGKQIPCEKTPQNVFYIEEILSNFPNAKVINMIRDPRAVMLSQKRKWKRRYLGADFITKREMIRLRINYHPVTIAKLWKSAISAVQPFEGHKRVYNLRFEDLISSPETATRELCTFLNLDYEAEMLQVPHAGSSSEADKKTEKGIKKSRDESFLEKGLTPEEISICRSICGKFMDRYNYKQMEVSSRPLVMAWQYALFPVKLGLALLWNLNRMRSIGDTIKRRLKSS